MALSLREGLGGLLTNKIDYSQLQVGDHIYSWRNMIYAHHGKLSTQGFFSDVAGLQWTESAGACTGIYGSIDLTF